MQKLNKAVAFFVEHAGSSWDPKTETEEQARLRVARALAKAEAKAWRAGLSFCWSRDPDIDSSEFSEETPKWELYQCAVMRGRECLASLHGIDFGRDRFPSDGDSYRRVVEAELALESSDRI